jgi:hypothetical protein
MRQGSFVEDHVADQARAERDVIERAAMCDQPGWMRYLNGLSDQTREIALRPILPRPIFERWRILTELIAKR